MNGLLGTDHKKQTAWFFGCSTTYGSGCHKGDEYYNKYKRPGDKIWTEIVAETLDYREVNLGVPGRGNIEILRCILDNKDNFKSDDMIVIGVTDGARIQSFFVDDQKVLPTSYTHWMIDGFPWHLKGLDQDFVDSLKDYMVNCRLRFINEHCSYDMKLIEDVVSLIKVKQTLIWSPVLWNKFENIATHTNEEINDFHWSFNGHKQMSEWILTNLK